MGFTDYMFWIMIIVVLMVIVAIISAIVNRTDDTVQVKSSKAVESYDWIKYFKEDRNRIQKVEQTLTEKQKEEYKVRVNYTSPAGRSNKNKVIVIHMADVQYVQANPSVVMSATEYNQIVRAQKQIEKERDRAAKEAEKAAEKARKLREKEALKLEQQTRLEEKRQEYYEKVNEVIDYSNAHKDELIIKSDKDELDRLVGDLYNGAYNYIKKAKYIESGEWGLFDIFIKRVPLRLSVLHHLVEQDVLLIYAIPVVLQDLQAFRFGLGDLGIHLFRGVLNDASVVFSVEQAIPPLDMVDFHDLAGLGENLSRGGLGTGHLAGFDAILVVFRHVLGPGEIVDIGFMDDQELLVKIFDGQFDASFIELEAEGSVDNQRFAAGRMDADARLELERHGILRHFVVHVIQRIGHGLCLDNPHCLQHLGGDVYDLFLALVVFDNDLIDLAVFTAGNAELIAIADSDDGEVIRLRKADCS